MEKIVRLRRLVWTLAALLLGGLLLLTLGKTVMAGTSPQSTSGTGTAKQVDGNLNLLWYDGRSASDPSGMVALLAVADGEPIELQITDETQLPDDGLLSLDQQPVTVHFAAEQRGKPAVRRIERRTLQPVATIGSERFVNILCKFADVTTEQRDLAYFRTMFSSTVPHMSHYWRTVSNDRLDLSNSAASGWYTLTQPASFYELPEGSIEREALLADCVASADAAVDFSQFDGINVIYNAAIGCCAWGGVRTLTLDGQTRSWRVTWLPPWAFTNYSVVAHEMGHSFGLPHSTGNYGLIYDNAWDVMSDLWRGRYGGPLIGQIGQQTIGYHKDRLQWIAPERKLLLSWGSQQTLTLHSNIGPAEGIWLATLRLDETRSYSLEARDAAGYDRTMAGEAVIIHQIDTRRTAPARIIDRDGNGETGDSGAMFLPGESFVDGDFDVAITVTAATTAGFIVDVVFGPETVECTPAADEVALYVDRDFMGKCRRYAAGVYSDTAALDLPPASVSSIRVGSDAVALLCSADNFGGICDSQTADLPDLSSAALGNNSVRSLQVQPRLLAPQTPQPLTPAAGASTSADLGPNLKWQATAGAAAYYVELLAEGKVQQHTGWISETSWSLSPLDAGSYSWRVKARNGVGESEWSDDRPLTVEMQQITLDHLMTADLAWNEKQQFDAGDPILWIAAARNTTGQPQAALVSWEVRDDQGVQLYGWQAHLTATGGTRWSQAGTVPSGAAGIHHFTATVAYQELTTTLTTSYTVSGTTASAGPLIVSSYTVDDDSVGGSSGNGDGILAAGETAELAFILRNTSLRPAHAVTATLTTSTPELVSIQPGARSFGAIGAYHERASSANWLVRVSATISRSETVVLCLEPRAVNGGPWHDCITAQVRGNLPAALDLRSAGANSGTAGSLVFGALALCLVTLLLRRQRPRLR